MGNEPGSKVIDGENGYETGNSYKENFHEQKPSGRDGYEEPKFDRINHDHCECGKPLYGDD